MTATDNFHPLDSMSGFMLTGCDLTAEEKDQVLATYKKAETELESGDNSSQTKFDAWCDEMDELLLPVL